MISCKAKLNNVVIAFNDFYTVVAIDGNHVHLENYLDKQVTIPNDFFLIRGVQIATARAEQQIHHDLYTVGGNL